MGICEKKGFDWMGSREIGIKSIHVSNAPVQLKATLGNNVKYHICCGELFEEVK